MMFDRCLVRIDFVQSYKVRIFLLDGNFKPLTGGFISANVISMLQCASKIGISMFWMKGQFDVKSNGIHWLGTLDKFWDPETDPEL